jgi:hypothetical protein
MKRKQGGGQRYDEKRHGKEPFDLASCSPPTLFQNLNKYKKLNLKREGGERKGEGQGTGVEVIAKEPLVVSSRISSRADFPEAETLQNKL